MNLSELRELLAKLSPSWDVQRSMQPDFGSGLAGKEAAFVNPDTQAAEAAARQAEVDQAFKWPAILAATLNAVPGLPALGGGMARPTMAGMPRRPKAPPTPPPAPEPVPQAPPRRIEPGVLAAAKAGDERAIEEILQVVRPMVRATGAKYGKMGPDAMQEANLIVLRNIQNAPEQPSHFMAAVRKELRNVGREIDPLREAAPLSRETRELLGRVERFKQQYYQKYGVQLADDRVIKKMGLSEFEQQALRDAYASPARAPKVELDKPRFDDTSEGFHSVTAQHEDASRSTPSVEGETAGQIPTPAEQLAQKDYRGGIL